MLCGLSKKDGQQELNTLQVANQRLTVGLLNVLLLYPCLL